MKALETVLVALGVGLVVVETTRRLRGDSRFLDLSETELVTISKALAILLLLLAMLYLLGITFFR